MSTVYFDKGAFSELWRSRSVSIRERERIRRRMSSLLFTRRPTLVLGPATITELADAPDEQRRAEVGFLQQLSYVRYLVPVPARIKEEVRASMLGEVPEPFLSSDEAKRVLSAALSSNLLLGMESAQLSSNKSGFVLDERQARESTLASAGNQKQLARWMSEWFRDPAQRVRDAVLKFMRAHRLEFGLPINDELWPAPEELRTLWAFQSYQLARFYLVSKDNRRTDPNDQADWRHFISAAYADQIVVEDNKFRQIIAVCPPPKPALVTFEQWAIQMLS